MEIPLERHAVFASNGMLFYRNFQGDGVGKEEVYALPLNATYMKADTKKNPHLGAFIEIPIRSNIHIRVDESNEKVQWLNR